MAYTLPPTVYTYFYLFSRSCLRITRQSSYTPSRKQNLCKIIKMTIQSHSRSFIFRTLKSKWETMYYRLTTLALSVKLTKLYRPKAVNSFSSTTALSSDGLFPGNPTNIHIILMFQKPRVLGYILPLIMWVYRYSNFCSGLRKHVYCAVECVMAVQGHPRLLISVPVVSDIRRLNGRKSKFLSTILNAFAPREPFRISGWTLQRWERRLGTSRRCRVCDLRRFDTVTARDKQTDRRTDISMTDWLTDS